MMFKDKYIHKFYAFALAAVFALTLAGCGGGGGTAAMPDPEPPAMPEPTPQETCEGDGGRYNADGSCTSAEELAAEMTEAEALSGAQEAAMEAYMAAMAAVGSAVDPVAAVSAQASADAAKAASDMAAAATDSATAMEHQMAAEAARDMAMEAAMTRGLGITSRANAAANQTAIDRASLEGVPVPAPISNAGRVGAALRAAAAATTVATANQEITFTDNVAETTPVAETQTINQGQATNAAAAQVSATSTYNASGSRIAVVNQVRAGTPTLVRGESPTPLMTRGGFNGAESVLVDPANAANRAREFAVAFTDINAPGQAYNTVAPILAATLQAAENTAIVTGDIPQDGSTFVGTYNVNPSDNAPPRSGRFFCAAPNANCAISVDSSGVLRGIRGYVFQPVIPNQTTPDSDYLNWGIWLQIPFAVPAPGAPAAAAVTAFASGSDPFQVPVQLTGTATYNGVANGLYSAGGAVEYFEADASLSADFGGRTGADSVSTDNPNVNDGLLFGAVTGSITNIKAGGMDVDGSIALGRAPLIGVAGGVATSFNGSTEASLGGRALTGAWAGQFFGPNRAQGVAARTEFPTTAAGTFGATTPIGPRVSILGAFGTWRAD